MYKAQRFLIRRIMILQVGIVRKCCFLYKKKYVLPVPPGNILIVPYLFTNTINRNKPLVFKKPGPVVGILLVDMISPTLPGNGGGKKNKISQSCKRINKNCGCRRTDMLAYFQTTDQI